LTEDDIVAQALMFFVAGFETSSSTLSYAMLEMARLPAVQQKARENIKDVLKRHNGTMNYQALQEMHYLDWIIDGALVLQSNHSL
jgi:cytochrome P450